MDTLIFSAFFSYCRHDVLTDGTLLTDFTTALENQLNARLVGTRFVIWRDEEEIRAADQRNALIETELRCSHILIILLTPRRIDSDHCRNEYSIFEEVEAACCVGSYVVPIFAREIKRQENHLSGDRKDVYERIMSRQYAQASATERTSVINKIANDIEGMIARLRLPGAELTGADLTGADFRRANIEGVCFDDAILTGVIGLSVAASSRRRERPETIGTVERYREGLGLAVSVAAIKERVGLRLGMDFAVRAKDFGVESGDEILLLPDRPLPTGEYRVFIIGYLRDDVLQFSLQENPLTDYECGPAAKPPTHARCRLGHIAAVEKGVRGAPCSTTNGIASRCITRDWGLTSIHPESRRSTAKSYPFWPARGFGSARSSTTEGEKSEARLAAALQPRGIPNETATDHGGTDQ